MNRRTFCLPNWCERNSRVFKLEIRALCIQIRENLVEFTFFSCSLCYAINLGNCVAQCFWCKAQTLISFYRDENDRKTIFTDRASIFKLRWNWKDTHTQYRILLRRRLYAILKESSSLLVKQWTTADKVWIAWLTQKLNVCNSLLEKRRRKRNKILLHLSSYRRKRTEFI